MSWRAAFTRGYGLRTAAFELARPLQAARQGPALAPPQPLRNGLQATTQFRRPYAAPTFAAGTTTKIAAMAASEGSTPAAYSVVEDAVASKGANVLSAAALVMTPETSLLGGLTIGVSAAGKLATTGRITGISGTLGGLLRGNLEAWRVAYLAGLVVGGLAALQLFPGCIPVLPESYTLTRAVSAGLLVGYGTALGHGCTSGHGICGLARLSKRSLAAVMTFMAVGAVVASVAQTGVAAGIPADLSTPWPGASPEQLKQYGSVLAASVATAVGLNVIAKLKLVPVAALGVASEFVFAAMFALGLGAGGMLNPAKVAAFLSPLAPYFDPSLMAVMGGALLVTTPTFQAFMRGPRVPSCSNLLDLPSRTAIDKPLLLGTAMFGAGWGLGGMCPGPALVSLAQPSPQVLSFVASMAVGMLLQAKKLPFFPAKSMA